MEKCSHTASKEKGEVGRVGVTAAAGSSVSLVNTLKHWGTLPTKQRKYQEVSIYCTITYIFSPKNIIYFAHLYVLFMYVFTYRPYHRHHATIEHGINAFLLCV